MFIYLPIRYRRFIKDELRRYGVETDGCRVLCYGGKVSLHFDKRHIGVGEIIDGEFKAIIYSVPLEKIGKPPYYDTLYIAGGELRRWNAMIEKCKPALKLMNKL